MSDVYRCKVCDTVLTGSARAFDHIEGHINYRDYLEHLPEDEAQHYDHGDNYEDSDP